MWAYSSGGGSQIDLETINNTKVRIKVKGMDVIMKKLPEVRRKHSQENPENYLQGKSSFISLLFSVAAPLKRRLTGRLTLILSKFFESTTQIKDSDNLCYHR